MIGFRFGYRFGFHRPAASLSKLSVVLDLMLVFRYFDITTTVSIAINILFEELSQNRFGYVQIDPDLACH
jgi:hypothetical protein